MNDTNSHTESSPTDSEHLAIRVHMMPKDTNVAGTVFGGAILSLIDQAGFYQARRYGLHRWVTVSMDAVEFRRPVWAGDVVSLFSSTERTGSSSVTIRVRVMAERFETGKTVEVTVARLTMVSVDAAGHPIPFVSPPSLMTPIDP
ncbi:MAG: acyl-CoA thioesterase [Phycisphaerae bacterium]|jgi:acyl-CoA thioesterase YciA|nr:acyl-CoA thioesterase [Phycisphaerae bacterium]MBT5656909.1 acyl-CoA thioesterase [Phycisphaerae bacterium]